MVLQWKGRRRAARFRATGATVDLGYGFVRSWESMCKLSPCRRLPDVPHPPPVSSRHRSARMSHGPLCKPQPPVSRHGLSSASTASHKIVRDNPCLFAHFCATLPSVNGREFIARVRKLARRNGIAGQVRPHEGQGQPWHPLLRRPPYRGERPHETPQDRHASAACASSSASTRTTFREFRSWQRDTATQSIFTRSARAASRSPSPTSTRAFTDGDTLAEAVAEAADCLEEALAGRIARREDIPTPSPAKGRPAAVPGAVLAAKTALYEALREERLSNSGFAAAMGIQESEVRRMLDPRHTTKIGRLEKALARFKKRLVVTVEEAA